MIIEFIVIKAISFKIISLVLFLASTITGLYTFIINPGVTFKEKNNNNNNQQGKNYLCPNCNFTYPKNGKTYQHCFSCQVCAPDSDHHCGIFGKCIGYKNKISFYLFPTFSIILLILCFVSVFYHFVNEVGNKKENNDKFI
jgi:hypothetical protein